MNDNSDTATARHVPDHLVADTLSRLPVKSLLRFTAACKSWYSLIHSKRPSQSPKILFITQHSQFQLLDQETPVFGESCLPCPFIFPPGSPTFFYGSLKILGSSNGLVCVAVRYSSSRYADSLFLWNPFTRAYRKVPHSRRFIDWFTSYAHGLGYDPVSNDLKMVFSESGSKMYSFSVKSNSWKPIVCPPKLDLFRGGRFNKATVVNGRFHWLVKAYRGDSIEIIAFDSTKDEFSNVSMPRDASCSLFSKECLLEHKGCLCFLFSVNGVEEMWMLKEHGWSRFLTASSKYIFPFEGLICVCSSDTQLVARKKNRILRYSVDKWKLEEFGKHSSAIYDVTVCAETLISPNRILDSLL